MDDRRTRSGSPVDRPRRLGHVRNLPRLAPETVERLEIRMDVHTRPPSAEVGKENPASLIECYHPEVRVVFADGGARTFAFEYAVVELWLEKEYGEVRFAWEEAESYAREGKDAVGLLRNEILDDELLPRDPHYLVKMMASIGRAVELIRAATGVDDLRRYRLWFVRDSRPWTNVALSDETLDRWRAEAKAVGFVPCEHTPNMIWSSGLAT